MREKARKTYSDIKEMTSILGILVSENWLLYSRLRTAFIIIWVPLLWIFLYLNLLGSILMTLLSLSIFFLLDTRKLIVAKTNPEVFVKSQKIERWVEISSLVIISSVYVFVFLVVPLEIVGYEHLIQYIVFAFVVVFFVGSGIIIVFFLNYIEYALSIIINRLPDSAYKRLKLFSNFYVSERISVRARICVVLDALSRNSDIKAIIKKTRLFKEGLSIYNDHLRTKFDFVMSDPDKFYKYVRLTALSNDQKNIAKVKEDLTSLIKLMEQKEDPFEFVRTVRAMIGESENKPYDLYQDIEIEPHFKKWVTAHADLLKVLISVIGVIISFVLNFVLKHL